MSLAPLDRQILALAIPMILSNITVPLLGLVDSAVLGHLPHAYYLGGSTVGAMIITFITWLCGFLRMSTTGLSAHALGQANSEQSLIVLMRGLLVALFIGVSLIVLQTPYLSFGLALAGGSEQVQFYAQQYAQIRVWGLPAALANIVLIGWLLGQHRAKAVMLLLITTNLINVILDLLFVVGFGWKVQGVALATLIAEYSGLALGLTIIGLSFSSFNSSLSFVQRLKGIVERSALLAYFKLNRDILIRTLCLEICFLFMTFQGARLGDNIVAANAILMNFLLLISFGLDGIANAAEALIGKAYGENNKEKIDIVMRRCLTWTAIFALCYAILFYLLGDNLISLISDIPSVTTVASEYLLWLIILPVIACWCYLYDGVYIGLMRATQMRNSMLLSTFGLFFPVWLLLQTYGNHGLWAAFSCFMLARGVTLAFNYYRSKNTFQDIGNI